MLQAVHQGVCVRDVYSVAEPLLLILVLVEGGGDVHPVIPIFTDGEVLQFGAVGEPLVDSIEVGVVI